MLELALLYVYVCVDTDQAGRACVVCGVALELATDHFDAGALESGDAGHLAIGLSEYSTIDNKRASNIGQQIKFKIHQKEAKKAKSLKLTRAIKCSFS